MKLDQLIVMHDEIRDSAKLARMVEYVHGGGLWTPEAIEMYAADSGDRKEPIYITQFEDGKQYLHDGHRRVTATYLGGRDHLLPSEYVHAEWKYHDYMVVKWEKNYLTPHDPRTEIRLSEFFLFKDEVLKVASEFWHQIAEAFILNNRSRYCRPRKVWTVEELARSAMRCSITNNPCGTDTCMREFSCCCEACKLWIRWWTERQPLTD